MEAVKGYFKDKTFISDSNVSIPDGQPVLVTILDFPERAVSEAKIEYPVPGTDISVERRIAALNRLVGIAANNPMTLEEIKDERLSRQ